MAKKEEKVAEAAAETPAAEIVDDGAGEAEILSDAPMLTCECGATKFTLTPIFEFYLVGDDVVEKQTEIRAHCLGDHREYNLTDPASVSRMPLRQRGF